MRATSTKRAHEFAAAAGVDPGFGLVEKGRAGDVDVGPRCVADELFQKLGGGDGSAPAALPTFLMSATSLLICSSYSANMGNCQTGSPTRLAAPQHTLAPGLIVGHQPGHIEPSATTQAPVSVARSMICGRLRSTATSSTSASTRRPSASVL